MPDMFRVTLPSALDAGVDFPKLNELRFNVKTLIPNELTRINIEVSAPTVMKVSRLAKFYNPDGTTDLGQSVNLTAGVSSCYIKPVGDFYVSIENKFAILRFGNNYIFSLPASPNVASNAVISTMDVKQTKYIAGLLKLQGSNFFIGDINNSPKTVTQVLTPCNTAGTVNGLNGVVNASTFNYSILTDLDLANQKSLTGGLGGINLTAIRNINLNNSSLNGAIASINNAVNTINSENNDVSANLSVFSGKTAISSFNLNGSLFYGDISNLSTVTLAQLNSLAGLNLSGDVSRLNNNCIYLNNANTPITLKNKRANLSTTMWTNKRADRTYILAVAGVRMTSGVDQFFIDMAGLELHPNAVTGGAWLRTISIIGTKTSASDQAVATLATKGVTVTVTNQS